MLVLLGFVLAVGCVASDVFAPEGGRLGHPPEQIEYRGSSPYFKVDFDRYTGEGTCVWCHPEAARIWNEMESFHVQAYAALDPDARRRPECVKCHVTAFNVDGSYPFENEAKRTDRELGFTWGGDEALNARFEGVQCEACHGPNCGNRYSRKELLAKCHGCHNVESPHFAGFSPERAVRLLPHAEV